jgi:alanine racemase
MDQAVVDLGSDHSEPGEPVTVLGPGTHGEPTMHDWASWSQTLPHEIVTGLGARLDRVTLRTGPRRLA